MRKTSPAFARRPWARAPLRVLVAAALTATALPAGAGDLAHRHILGFSPSGDHFAFEEYGVQDGSGFPYANIYVIDTRNDTWVDGTPVRVRDETVEGGTEDVRDDAHAEAGPILEAAGIEVPGNHVASNPVTELSADARTVTVNPRHTVQPIGEPVTLTLQVIPLDGAEICADWGQTMGFSVVLQRSKSTRTLHEDTSIPESRGCPLNYRIADVLTHFPDNGPPVIAVLILYQRVGFEGPDGRWLAVTARLD